MVQLADLPFWVEEEAPELNLAMPRVWRRPALRRLRRGRASVRRLAARAAQARTRQEAGAFGKAYGELASEFQPLLQWAMSYWDYLLTRHGCRFLARDPHEKLYCRGDYRVFTERDFEGLIHRCFRRLLEDHLERPSGISLERQLRRGFWPAVEVVYHALENPPDPAQRKLTGWSYLRCVPYRFLNPYHHRRVHDTVRALSGNLRRVVELYYLSFRREEAAAADTGISLTAFRHRRSLAQRQLAGPDYLSFVLLQQIERY